MALLLPYAWYALASPPGSPGRIEVVPDRIIAHLTRHMTGACLEDVNHEVYGGIYSQMLFGESFQEPPVTAIEGFQAYGGVWRLTGEGVTGEAGPGYKLVRLGDSVPDATVGVELRFADATEGNAGLILRVDHPGVGADRFEGYEVSLDPSRGVIVLGKHRQDWQPLAEADAPIAVGEWIPLAVELAGGRLSVSVGGRTALVYDDVDSPLQGGGVGLRTWQRPAEFRDLWIDTGDGRRSVPLRAQTDGGVAGAVSGMWGAFATGEARGEAAITIEEPFVGAQSQRLTHLGGEGAVGLENRGLNRQGLALRGGRPYECVLWARAGATADLQASLQCGSGSRTYAQAEVRVPSGDWTRLTLSLTPDADVRDARFVLSLASAGSVDIGYAYLGPGDWGLFKGLPCRRDVVQALTAQGATVLRYGGCMAEAPEYRWKSMIGPRDQRQPYRGFWYPYSTNGWGIIDFLNLCEAAGFEMIPCFMIDETPEDMADFLQYAKGGPETVWGARRVADGHPEPYPLRFIQLGNEETVDEAYWRRFERLAETIWALDSEITLVVGDFAYNETIEDPYHFTGAPTITSLGAHQKILDLAARHGREVWFDVHVWSEAPEEQSGIAPLPSLAASLERLSPSADFRLAVFELNAVRHDLGRAIANARSINRLERMGDLVRVVCSANCLQIDGQNDNGWDQGLLFLNPEAVWAQPPAHVMRMLSERFLPYCVDAHVSGAPALDVTAKTDETGSVLQIQVVNNGPGPQACDIDLGGFRRQSRQVEWTTLTGERDARNTADAPDRVVPTAGVERLPRESLAWEFPGYSFTILRLR